MPNGVRRAVVGAACSAAVALCISVFAPTYAQIAPSAQNIAPVFEGWEPNPDGSFNLVFGYFNRNWDHELDLPVGPDNVFEPGNPDQGQPTHFYPRRSRFIFKVRVPKDFGSKEVVWTLTVNGKTEKAYATLKPDYILSPLVYMANSGESMIQSSKNVPPVLKMETQSRQVKVNTPVTLTAVVTDDGIPKASALAPPGSKVTGAVPRAAMGLRFSWLVYRGAGKVTFDPPQLEAWEDDRDGRNSPYSSGWGVPPAPPNNMWVVKATFSEPGTYVLRGLAHDGALATPSDITFTVIR